MKPRPWKVIRAAAVGGSIGWIPPTGGYVTLHGGLDLTNLSRADTPLLITLAACIVFSVRTVWLWGHESWGEPVKAGSLVVSLEGLMLFGPGDWLPLVALSALIGLNAYASGEHLAKRARAKVPAEEPSQVSQVSREPILPVPARARRMKESPA